jgi:hypothetical protein
LAALAVFVAVLAWPAGAQAAMTIDSGPRVAVNSDQVTIWWHSSDTGSSELVWDTANRGDWGSFANDASNTATTLGTVHSRSISGLPAGTYYYRVRSTGAAGTATSGTHSFTIELTGNDPIRRFATTEDSCTFCDGVRTSAFSPDGSRLYFGGTFDWIVPYVGDGMQVDGASTIQAGTPMVSGASAALPDGTGGTILAGAGLVVGGLERGMLARLLPDGGLDPYWHPDEGSCGGYQSAETVTISGGIVYVGGSFDCVGPHTRYNVAAVDLATSEVTDWDPAPDSGVSAIEVNGSVVYVGGYFSTIGGASRNYLAALDAGTGVSTSWNPNANDAVKTIDIAGANAYVGGSFSGAGSIGGASRNRLAAISLATGNATSWNPNVSGSVEIVLVQAGTVYLGGTFTTVNGTTRRNVAAVPTGSNAPTAWNPDVQSPSIPRIEHLHVTGSTAYLAGEFNTVGATPRRHLAAVDLTTGAATAWNPAPLGPASTVTTLDNGNILIAGGLRGLGALQRFGVAAVDVSTGTVTSFNPGASASADVTAIVPSGTSVWVGGYFSSMGGQPRTMVAEVQAATGNATAWNSFVNTTVADLELAGTSVWIAGDFGSAGGSARSRIAELSATTGVATAWTAGAINSIVNDIELLGGTLFAGGSFTLVNGNARQYLAAMSTATGATLGWDPAPDNSVFALETDAGHVYVGGHFTTIAGQSRSRLAKLDPATGAATPWNVAANNNTNTLAWHQGRLATSGNFGTIGGLTRPRGRAIVDPATGAVESWNPLNYEGSDALTSHGTMLASGGSIYELAGTMSRTETDTGALSITTAAQHNVAPYQTTVWWSTSASSSSELVWDRVSRSSWSGYQNDISNTATNLGTVHSRTISNLPQGVYYYRVRSRTAGGEQVTSPEYSFRVEPPDAATPLGATVTNNVSAVVQSGNRVYIGGSFTDVGVRRGSGLELDSTSAALHGGTPQVAGAVHAAINDAAGGRYIGGEFTQVGGLPRARIARLLPDGGVDPYFDAAAGFNSTVQALALDGSRLYAGGSFDTYGGAPRRYVAALDATTAALDMTFVPPGTGFDSSIHALAVSGPRLYAGGWFGSYNGTTRRRIAALDTTTAALDTTFVPPGTGFNSVVNSLATSGALVYAGGSFTTYNGTARNRIAALNATTAALDTTFVPPGTGLNDTVQAVVVSGAVVYAGGSFTNYNGTARNRIAALNATTAALDPTFVPPGTGFNDGVSALAVSGTRLYAGGYFTNYNGTTRRRIAALDTTTAALDVTFDAGNGFNSNVNSLAISGTRVYAGGHFTTYAAATRPGIAALDSTTAALDTTFVPPGTGFNGHVSTLAISGTRIYVGGEFTSYNGASRGRIAALDATTAALDTTFVPPGTGFSHGVRAVVVSGGLLYAGGAFNFYNGVSRNSIAALNATTAALDTTFVPPGTGFDSTVNTIAISGTRLYAGGWFGSYNGTTRNRIAALNTTTAALDTTFVPPGTGFDSIVSTLTISGTRLYVGGWFSNYNGASRSNVAALDATTAALDPTFVPPGTGFGSPVEALAISGSRLYVGGNFTSYNGTTRNRIAALDATTAMLDPSFDPAGAFDAAVRALAVVGGHVYAGGDFTSANGVSQSGFAMFDTCDRAGFCDDEMLRDYVTISLASPTFDAGSTLEAGAGGSTTSSLAIDVRSNAFNGYTLLATDASDTAGLACAVGNCAGFSIPDWSGSPATPTAWPDTGANYGFGVTVLGSTLTPKNTTRWGTGVAPDAFGTLNYAGLELGTTTQLHTTSRYVANTTDTTTLGLRARVNPAQRAGAYSTTIGITVLANP